MILTIIFILSLCVYILYRISTRKFDYWQKKNVNYVQPTPFLGNYSGYILLKENLLDVVYNLSKLFPNDPYVGAFFGTKPTLIVKDPEFIKLVLTKDFFYFTGKECFEYTHKEVITQGIIFTYGDRWKVIRQNVTPLFSSSKMRSMFRIIEHCSGVFENLLDEESLAPEVEMKSLMSRFTMDCIGGCVFGVDINAMQEPKDNIFTTMGCLFLETTTSRGIKNVVKAIWPEIFYGLGFKVFPTDIHKFFSKLLVRIFEARDYKPSERTDFVDLLLNLKKNRHIVGDRLQKIKTGDEGADSKLELEVNDDLLVAQCVSFFIAGFETSSNSLTFTLYELAKNPDVQKRAQKEVDEYIKKHNNKLDYDCVKELPFVEACIDEALRLYPLFGVISRQTGERYTFPTGLTLDKGDRVHIPVYHLHHDPEYFPEPELFKPERFYGEEKKNIRPFTYLPFGAGPRVCIGERFAKMQMLAGLVPILKRYTVRLAEGMPETINFEPKAIASQPNIGVRLNLLPRNN
ncbi:cytochrome P450 6B4-like isoform X3 [Bombyx mandarina]|uniref:unspecific monooxygenase n=1 Tax=Bombyx mandarina TaxID=7092 RepID=A0A6J2JE13_BOMMA|nr:cytochrome P450 6B4-like isoform X1 [Bombyx mandarina]XP_028026745.1 cytochrome P450 6B4-like isoform X2 [Bombyx mandarina]XP_028026746.1 cytochrome P450 6B4-like isoform X3 [Bombyx mandarina]